MRVDVLTVVDLSGLCMFCHVMDGDMEMEMVIWIQGGEFGFKYIPSYVNRQVRLTTNRSYPTYKQHCSG